jgi:putative nucleotidyltransferase with HDIG domain
MNSRELVARIKNLPPASQAATRLVNLLGQQSVSNEDLVEILRCDSVLTAKLLRACNSPISGLKEPVSSVDQAVFILGHDQILQLVLSLGFGKTMALRLTGYGVETNELWQHSLISAAAAKIVAITLDLPIDAPVAFTAGLLHDIGKVVMNQVLTTDFQTDIRLRVERDGMSRVDAERTVLGVDHAEVGAELLQTWHLPKEIVEAVRYHHEPLARPQPNLSAVSHAANCLAHVVGSAPGWDGYATRVDQRALTDLGLAPQRLDELVVTVREALEEVAGLISAV